MNEFLAAARRFEASCQEINLLDLGIALLLEDFAAPMLVVTRYVRLRDRQIMGPIDPELESIAAGIILPDAAAQDPEALELIGRGLEHRYRLMRNVNRVGLLVRSISLLGYLSVCMAIILGPNMQHAAAILGGWLFAVSLAMIVCLCNWHWRPRAGLRGGSG